MHMKHVGLRVTMGVYVLDGLYNHIKVTTPRSCTLNALTFRHVKYPDESTDVHVHVYTCNCTVHTCTCM